MRIFMNTALLILMGAVLLVLGLGVNASDNRDALAASYSSPEYKYDANGWMGRNLSISPVIPESSSRHETRCIILVQEIAADQQLEENLRSAGFGSVSCADQKVKF